MKKYRTLRFIVGLNYIFAALLFLAAIIVPLSMKQDAVMSGGIFVGGVFLALFVVANAQLLEVFVDIARNTGATSDSLKNR